MISIIYASTGGATREVAVTMARQLGPRTRLVDLATFDWNEGASLLSNDLVIAGGPTYGKGDWHYLWSSRFRDVAPIIASARQVALFGLGDTRFHGSTFGGSLGKLHVAVTSVGVRPTGMTPAGRHTYRSTPSLYNGVFPGLVVDYRLDAYRLGEVLSDWLETLLPAHRCMAGSALTSAKTSQVAV